MSRGVHRLSKNWVKNHLTVTLVKQFHRRKNSHRAIKRFFKNQDYYNFLGNSVGICFILSVQNQKPQLLIKRIKQEETD
jgi:hypothetical protein